MLGFWRTAPKIAHFEGWGLDLERFSLGDFGRHGSGGIFEGPWALVLTFLASVEPPPKSLILRPGAWISNAFARRPWPSRFWRNL